MVKHLSWCTFLVMLMLLVAACSKNDPAPDKPVTMLLSVVNAAASDKDVFNFYLKGTRQNTTSILNGVATEYLQVPEGQQLLSIKGLFDTDNFNNADTLLTYPYNIVALNSIERYSFFVAGNSRNDAFVLRDTLTTDTANARLRFVSASSAVPAYTVTMNDTLRFNMKAYRSASKYAAVGTGAKKVRIAIPGVATPLQTTLTLRRDSVYTLFTYGGIGADLRLGILRGR